MEFDELINLVSIPEELENDDAVNKLAEMFADTFYKTIRDISEEVPEDNVSAENSIAARHITANVAAKGFVKAYARYLNDLIHEYNNSKEEDPDGTDAE